MRRPLAAFATCLLIVATVVPAALAGQVEDERAGDASRVLGEILRIPEDRIPDKLLAEAEAIAVIPNVIKAGFRRRRPARPRPDCRSAAVTAPGPTPASSP